MDATRLNASWNIATAFLDLSWWGADQSGGDTGFRSRFNSVFRERISRAVASLAGSSNTQIRMSFLALIGTLRSVCVWG